MKNVTYFVVALVLVWTTMVGYLGYIHYKLDELRGHVESSRGNDE